MPDGTKHKTARNLAHMSREKAAEKLYSSVSTLKRVESGKQQCDPLLESRMAAVYGFQWVADPSIPNDYKPMPLPQAALKLSNELEDAMGVIGRVKRIVEDGVVKPDELADFQNGTKEVKEAMEAARNFLYAWQGGAA